jgi:hypothetical protein
MRWVSTNDPEPLPNVPIVSAGCRRSFGIREDFFSPNRPAKNKKWAASPLALRPTKIDQKAQDNIMDAQNPASVFSLRDPRPAPDSEKGSVVPDRSCLFLVASRRPVRRPHPPVLGTAGQPLKGRVIGDPFEHPAQIIPIVGCKAKFCVVGHDFGQAVERRFRHETALVVATFRPWIGEQDEHTIDRCRQ